MIGYLARRLAGALFVLVGLSLLLYGLFYLAPSDPAVLTCEERWDPRGRSVVAPALDDRPFLYLRERSIPPRYLTALGLVLLASVAFIRVGGGSFRPMFLVRSADDTQVSPRSWERNSRSPPR